MTNINQTPTDCKSYFPSLCRVLQLALFRGDFYNQVGKCKKRDIDSLIPRLYPRVAGNCPSVCHSTRYPLLKSRTKARWGCTLVGRKTAESLSIADKLPLLPIYNTMYKAIQRFVGIFKCLTYV